MLIPNHTSILGGSNGKTRNCASEGRATKGSLEVNMIGRLAICVKATIAARKPRSSSNIKSI